MINLYLGIVCIFIINHFGEAMGGSDLVDFVWMGGLTKDGVVVKMSLMEILEERFYLQVEYFGRKWTFNGNAVKENSMLYEFHVTGLPASGIVYEYRILLENEMVYLGKFELPKVLEVYNFTFAFSSCQDETSDPKVYESIGVHEPLFFAHLGDLHYDNIDFEDSLLAYRSGYLNALHAPAGKAMLGMKVPMVYMYDDHDFGPDNSDKTAPGRKYALQTYREYVPHYPLHTSMEKGGGAVFQEFVIGRVLFLLTDLRSMRTPNGDVDSKKKTVLGKLQKKWFKDMIDAVMKKPHKDITTIVWCSTMPWLDDERKWGHFKYEQAEIVQFLKTYQKKKKLYIISGDAHMIAVDDGTNSPGNIPVFHAAALGRPGTIKGGPYSHGAFPGNGNTIIYVAPVLLKHNNNRSIWHHEGGG